jgi:hypothetical protein
MPIRKLAILLPIIILLIILPITSAQPSDPYQVVTAKILGMLSYNFYYSFSSYNQTIYNGIASAQLSSSNTTFYPNNTATGLMSLAIQAYNSFVSGLDNGNIKNASFYLGEIIYYGIKASNPFLLPQYKNSSTANYYDTMIKVELLGNLTIYKNYTVTGVVDAFLKIAKNDENIYKMLNATTINTKSPTAKDFNLTKELLSMNLSIIYALINYAIYNHYSNSFITEVYYLGIILSIVAISLVYLNIKRFRKNIKLKQ